MNTHTSPFFKWVAYFYATQPLCAALYPQGGNDSYEPINWRRIQNGDSYSFKKWMANSHPNALFFHNCIASENGFRMKRRVKEIEIGDIIAIRYTEQAGYLMLVRNHPREVPNFQPHLQNARQYEVEVFHSSKTHGFRNDTPKPPLGWDGERDFFWLFAGNEDEIIGYAQPYRDQIIYYPQSEHALIVGELL